MRAFRCPRKLVHIFSIIFASSILWIIIQITTYKHRVDQASRILSRSKDQLIPERIVHLDFKGGAPGLPFLRDLVPLLATAGATALLVEYEDTFPYNGTLRNLSTNTAWRPSQLAGLLEVARSVGMAVIPLVPTLGHMEFALKLAENSRLREVPEFPDTACPSEPAVRTLITEMLRQVLALHPECTSLHLGFDEARLSTSCRRCAAQKGDEILIRHLKWVAKEARVLRPELRVLIWDDMFRSWSLESLSKEAQIWNVVQPVVWSYSQDVNVEIPPRTWLGYQRTFPTIWIASAYMGADGETSVVPNALQRWRNNMSWLKRARAAFLSAKSSQSQRALMNSKSLSAVRAVVLTGWSRYDHFGLLCEKLPLAVPSLVLTLLLVSMAAPAVPVPEDGAALRWKALLNCSSSVKPPTGEALVQDPWLWAAEGCSFPGVDLMRSVKLLIDLRDKVDALEHEWRCQKGWLSTLSVARNWTSTARLFSPQLEAQALSRRLGRLSNELGKLLRRYFDSFAAAEWLSQNAVPAQVRSAKIVADVKALKKRTSWSRGRGPLADVRTFDYLKQC